MREMKDSGVEWIGEIPKNWKVYRLKYLLNGNLKYGANESGVEYDEALPRYIRITDIAEDGHLKTEGKLSLTEEMAEGYLLSDGDILFARSGASVGKSFIFREEYGKSAFAGYLIRARVDNKKVLPNLVYYNTLGIHYELWKNSIFNQATIQNIGADKYSNLLISLPECEEQQQQIADFLDTKCAKIDAVIVRQEAIIEKLKAYKVSVITEAVTKGLNPDAEMKDSGAEWIGKINSKYRLLKLKNVADILDQYRRPISADQRSQDAETLYDYYGASGVIDKIDGYTIDDHVMLIGEDGANLVMRNLPLMYEVNGKAWINNHAHILKPKKNISFVFLFLQLECLDLSNYITGSAQPKLNQENLKNIWIVVPDYEEQQQIASFLDTKCSKIDADVVRRGEMIDKLKAYKKSLIYEVVTGKRAV